MKIYLVGGAVRDELLGLPIKEKDWVVVGTTVNQMLDLGFRPVGKDFPVFLHPETNEEYALARTERKVGPGYAGFTFNVSAAVTLEEDLARRDLTINAMAKALSGEVIDPYGGKADLTRKILRHVSDAFVEDPVRILRVGRFLARYLSMGFVVAPETNQLMKNMVEAGEVDALVAERVWKELERALSEKHPEAFFQVLADCHALPILFPNLNFHKQELINKLRRPEQRFAAFFYDYPAEQFNWVCQRYRVPNEYRDLTTLIQKNLAQYQNIDSLSAEEIVIFLQTVDAFRREKRFNAFLEVCRVCSPKDFSERLLLYLNAANSIPVKSLIEGLSGPQIASRLFAERVKKVAEVLKSSLA